MGDWSIGTNWAFAPDDESALGMYQWFEEMTRQMDRGEVSYPSVMRFGFVTPRLIVSIWSQKWGESDLTHEIESDNPAIALITSQSEIALSGGARARAGVRSLRLEPRTGGHGGARRGRV